MAAESKQQLLESLVNKLRTYRPIQWQESEASKSESFDDYGINYTYNKFSTTLDKFEIILEKEIAENWKKTTSVLSELETTESIIYRLNVLLNKMPVETFEGDLVKTLYLITDEKIKAYYEEQDNKKGKKDTKKKTKFSSFI